MVSPEIVNYYTLSKEEPRSQIHIDHDDKLKLIDHKIQPATATRPNWNHCVANE
jgi:hypothetical protein